MIFLDRFHIPSRREDEDFFDSTTPGFRKKNRMTCYSSYYPFVMFRDRGMPAEFEFRDITVLCGNNGSGKSTVLNVIAEKLGLKRGSAFNQSDYFRDYVELCTCSMILGISPDSRIITSDDVFDRIMDIRRLNDGIDDRRSALIREYIENHGDDTDTTLHGLDDYERWRRVSDARNKHITQSHYLRSRLIRNVQERSNGESALSFFVDSIADGGLYLLDEPENSLSPSNQLELKYFLEDCVRSHGCQFILSTHSPFLLSLRGARIYDLDACPVRTCRWNELDCVRVYHDFFAESAAVFEKD